ncbi:hypothetical protein tpqmel_0487 [Candidatus Gastranaerophilus sp. (ex Termes propinquus)]|nr:hypothetical protein tpqmel_0487 [Candidatus Gastranaerophilus sp. (ex Termes propinquus)]
MPIRPQTLNIASKAVGALGLGAVLLDSNALGVRKAESCAKQGIAKETIRQHIGSSKMDYPSPMYNVIKESNRKLVPNNLISTLYGIGGYFRGLYQGVVNNLPLVGFSALALLAKKPVGRKVGIVGAGLSALYGCIKNGTHLFENKKYLD